MKATATTNGARCCAIFRSLFLMLALLLTNNYHLSIFKAVVLCKADELEETSIVSYPLIPNHIIIEREQRRRDERGRRSLLLEEEQLSSLLYQGDGTHYVDLWCGSPIPQRQTVIVDTGTTATAFPCNGCEDCGSNKSFYEQTQSSTFQDFLCNVKGDCKSEEAVCRRDHDGNFSHCTIDYAYGCSDFFPCWRAIESIDRCYLGGTPQRKNAVGEGKMERNIPASAVPDNMHAKSLSFDLLFGCQVQVRGWFKTMQDADGILGMDRQEGSFWSQMFQSGKMGEKKQFALCFSRKPFDPSKRAGIEAGALTMGGVDKRLHLSEMVYTANATTSSHHYDHLYHVEVRNIYLRHGSGGEFAKSSNPMAEILRLNVSQTSHNTGEVIVDSGTTDTWWNHYIEDEFKTAFKHIVGKDFVEGRPCTFTKDELAAMPTILFQFVADPGANGHILRDKGDDGDTTTEVVAGNLAGTLDPDHPNDVIFAFPPSHYLEMVDDDTFVIRFGVREHGNSILGANAMMGHDILFDIENNRLGWAESHCDYSGLIHDSVIDDHDESKDDRNNDSSKVKPTIDEIFIESSRNEKVSTFERRGETPKPSIEQTKRYIPHSFVLGSLFVSVVFLFLYTSRRKSTIYAGQQALDKDVEMVTIVGGVFSPYKDYNGIN